MKFIVVWCCLMLLGMSLPVAAQENAGGRFPGLNAATDWPWWRGPWRNGVATSREAVPTSWSATENVKWKTPVPGRGHSSPIVVGDRVFMATADEASQVQSVLALDRASGKSLWKVDVSQGGFPKNNHSKNTEASSTLACDGERLFGAFFHHETIEAVALDLAGKPVWRKTAGKYNPRKYEYGYAASPLIYQDLVIFIGEFDGDSFLAAFDRATGAEKWRTKRPHNISFSSPVVAKVAGRDQLFISGANQIVSYDPATGKPLWSTAGTTDATCGTMIWEGDLVFASGGYPKSETISIKADGSSEVVWKNNQKCYEQSMLVHDGYIYAFTDQGVMNCWRSADGKEMWVQRLRGPVSASPVLAGGNIYWTNERGTTYVFRPNPEKFDRVAENQLGEEGFASPAVGAGQLFLRTSVTENGKRQEYLYCIAK
jgi:outer membrane protein assembly factor BamB